MPKTAGSGYCSVCGRRVTAYAWQVQRVLCAFRHEEPRGKRCTGSGRPVTSPARYEPQGAK